MIQYIFGALLHYFGHYTLHNHSNNQELTNVVVEEPSHAVAEEPTLESVKEPIVEEPIVESVKEPIVEEPTHAIAVAEETILEPIAVVEEPTLEESLTLEQSTLEQSTLEPIIKNDNKRNYYVNEGLKINLQIDLNKLKELMLDSELLVKDTVNTVTSAKETVNDIKNENITKFIDDLENTISNCNTTKNDLHP
jgi:hypothetical protein